MSAVHLAVDDPSPCETCEGGRQISDHGGVGPCPDCCCVICGASTTTPPECDGCFMESERYWRWRQ